MNSVERLLKRQFNIRGMLTFWIIFLLHKKPMNGYEIVKAIESSTVYWKPTAGAVYPALHRLKKMGFIKIEKTGKREQKVYSLTESGKLVIKQMKEHIAKRSRDSRIRRIMDSLIWPDEPEEIREMFDKLFISISDFRNSLKGKYKDYSSMKKAKMRLNKIIEELKV
ncbi:MAG: PadR family transcriptional regulator [Candidatus Aenigmatarchaeota archaeon]|nr:PadR family transcriptional regulator [Candidatus Aenigmarchaeota archaeon]